jgi:hypothetical protein
LKPVAKKLLTGAPFILLIVAASWAVCLHFFKPPLPPIGTYVAILAFAAAAVTIWPPEESGWSKATWVILFATLMAFEVHNLYRDRTQHDREQNEARQREDDRFAGILKQNQAEFEATMGESRRLSQLSEKSLNNITGGTSYAYLTPQVSDPSPLSSIPLAIHNYGSAILTGVTVRIEDVNKDEPFDASKAVERAFAKPIEVGTLFPAETRPLAEKLAAPIPRKDGTHLFIIQISAQNGWVSETLVFRPSKKGLPWAYYLQVHRREVPIGNGRFTKSKLLEE